MMLVFPNFVYHKMRVRIFQFQKNFRAEEEEEGNIPNSIRGGATPHGLSSIACGRTAWNLH